jgi:hypothetical protein
MPALFESLGGQPQGVARPEDDFFPVIVIADVALICRPLAFLL